MASPRTPSASSPPSIEPSFSVTKADL
jgi:hypothetical protein